MKQYIVDAFTDKPFSGNPAAVCVMDKWPKEDFMMKLAMENNLSETAYIVKEEQGYHLRSLLRDLKLNYAVTLLWHLLL